MKTKEFLMEKLWNGEEGKGLRYIVKYATYAEQIEVNSFNNLKEAIEYCKNEVKGFELYNGDGVYDKANTFWYEIYDTSIPNWQENFEESSIYTTNEYWR